ncbi:uncharacterized protein [Porites lutea]|uniref:uncharacterized protein n=1 Tax=Porites lutea TaxID=51062 RepID=UPI003CC64C5E
MWFESHSRAGCYYRLAFQTDDISLLEFSISRAQSQLTRTANAAADLGLVISAPKTEYITINCCPQPPLEVYGSTINHVQDFKYLGSMMASSSGDLKRRKGLAWTAFWKLERLWRCPNISISTKIKLFNTTCVTVLLYGCESWGGSCRKQWKARSMPLVPHVIELCSTSRELIGCPMLKSMI